MWTVSGNRFVFQRIFIYFSSSLYFCVCLWKRNSKSAPHKIMSTTSSLFDSLLKLPPEVLEKMGFQRPSPTISESDGSDTDNGQNNKRDKKSSDEAIAAEMLKPLIFDDDSASADTPPPRPAWNASPSEIFSLCHPAGPQFFVRDNFLGRDSAMRVRKAVQELRAAGALRAAGMGREGSKVRVTTLLAFELLNSCMRACLCVCVCVCSGFLFVVAAAVITDVVVVASVCECWCVLQSGAARYFEEMKSCGFPTD